MLIQSLRLQFFKNHKQREFAFSPQINCFTGNNGAGKTNILDALYYLSMGKSFLGNTDQNNITTGEEFFVIEAHVFDGEKEDILKIQQKEGQRKIVKKNDKIYDRLADHIGYLPSVIISPYDQNLISDSGSARRKFLDQIISQTDSEYLYHLIQYQKALKQRNALLKAFQKNRMFDADSLEPYDAILEKSGSAIFEKRKQFTRLFAPQVAALYETISAGKEKITISYESDLHETGFTELLKQNLDKDRILTYTSKGIHKDDLLFEMDGLSLRKAGSQGQQKTFLIALKLAQIQMIQQTTKKSPILLLDDIFDKLDEHRVSQLVSLVNRMSFGQIFITDTSKERVESIVNRIDEESKIFEI